MNDHPDSAPALWHAPRLDWPVTTVVGPGLDGAIACGTNVAARNPETGGVSYRGVPVLQLAATRTFEEVACLLVCGYLPVGDGSDAEGSSDPWLDFRDSLRAARELPDEVADLVRAPTLDISPLRLLRAGISAMGSRLVKEPDHRLTPQLAAAIIGECAGLLMLLATHRAGSRESGRSLPGVPRDTGLDGGLVLALGGGSGQRIQRLAEVLPWVCTMVADDGLDAATFAGMVVGSCEADPWSAVVATLSAFEGSVARPQSAVGKTDAAPDERLDLIRNKFEEIDLALGKLHAAGVIDPEAAQAPSVLTLAAALLLERGLDHDPDMIPAVLALPRLTAMLARLCEFQAREPRLFRPLARYIGAADRDLEPG